MKVLELMYEYQIVVDEDVIESKSDLEKFYEGGNSVVHISEEADLTVSQGWENIDYLIAAGFVEEVGESPSSKFGLTQEGLQLAHQIKTERQQHNTNVLLVALTVVLTVLTVALVGIDAYNLFF